MFKSLFVVALLMAALGVACNRDKTPDTSTTSPPAATATDRTLSAADTEFIQKAAKGNEAEVELAKMAQDKAQDPKVKDFAKQLEDDHQDALGDLRRIASKANVTLDTTPPAEKATLESKLSTATGIAFDRAYVNQMIDDHKTHIAEFERVQATATGDVKEFIDKTLSVMREHLQKAEELAGNTAERK